MRRSARLRLPWLLVRRTAGARHAAAAQQSVNFYLGGFVPRTARTPAARDDVLVQQPGTSSPSTSRTSTARRSAASGWSGWATNFEAGLGVGIYSRTVPSVYTSFVNSDGTRDRAGPQAAHRAVHGHGPLPAARRTTADPAVRRRGRRRLRLALQRERAVRRLHRRQHLPRHVRRQRHERPVRSMLGGVRVPIGDPAPRRRGALSVGEGQAAGGPGVRGHEDRSRRVQLPASIVQTIRF